MNENNQLARIRWACRRGMLELDLILLPFFENDYLNLSKADQDKFVSLLSCTDPEIYSWLMGHQQPEDEDLKNIVTIIRKKVIELA